MREKYSFAAFLRGINVGGNHKLPMADLKREMETLGLEGVKTILNSGNAVFNSAEKNEDVLESMLEVHLEKMYKFPVPVMVRRKEELQELILKQPFKDVVETKDTRLYVSFLKKIPVISLEFPWVDKTGSYRILSVEGKTIFSVLDLSVSKTTEGMDMLERMFGKNITTRNMNTIIKTASLFG